MFNDHQPLISQHARTPDGFADVVTFVIASQHRQFSTVRQVLERHYTGQPAGLSTAQQKGVAYIRHHAEHYLSAVHAPNRSTVEVLMKLITIPQLGIPKAGFVCQLVLGKSACLDVHNLRLLGCQASQFATSANPLSTIARIQTYCWTVRQAGGTEQLWNGWCELIANKYPTRFTSADDVSVEHLRCVMVRQTL